MQNAMAQKLEPFLIPIAKWNKGEIARIIPDKIREQITDFLIRKSPVGVGKREDVGYFVLGTGQEPFVIWIQNEAGYDASLDVGHVHWVGNI